MVVMGTKDRAFAALPPVTLEDLIPPDAFYRRLERVLDLGFVRELVRDVYSDIGRSSIDLVRFFEGIRSERKRIATAIANTSAGVRCGSVLAERQSEHRLARDIGETGPGPTQPTTVTARPDSRPPLPPFSTGWREQLEPLVLRFTADDVVAMAAD